MTTPPKIIVPHLAECFYLEGCCHLSRVIIWQAGCFRLAGIYDLQDVIMWGGVTIWGKVPSSGKISSSRRKLPSGDMLALEEILLHRNRVIILRPRYHLRRCYPAGETLSSGDISNDNITLFIIAENDTHPTIKETVRPLSSYLATT
jgi:hypothetical protein